VYCPSLAPAGPLLASIPSKNGSPLSYSPLPFVSVNFSESQCWLFFHLGQPGRPLSSQRSGMDHGFRHCTLHTSPARATATAMTLPVLGVAVPPLNNPVTGVKYCDTTLRVVQATAP
jgi:hypothetical protein